MILFFYLFILMNLMIPGYLLVCFKKYPIFNNKLILINNIECDSIRIKEYFIEDTLFKLLNNIISINSLKEINTDIYIIWLFYIYSKNIDNISKNELALFKTLLKDKIKIQKYIDILVKKISFFNSKSIEYIIPVIYFKFVLN